MIPVRDIAYQAGHIHTFGVTIRAQRSIGPGTRNHKGPNFFKIYARLDSLQSRTEKCHKNKWGTGSVLTLCVALVKILIFKEKFLALPETPYFLIFENSRVHQITHYVR